MRDFPDDTFTENDVLRCLDAAGKQYKVGSRYILVQCPTHEDEHPSAQIYKDDWFVNCNAGCGRYHIAKAFPELRGDMAKNVQSASATNRSKVSEGKKVNYKQFNLYGKWRKLPKIADDHVFKGIPIQTLHDMGWRWDREMNGYFIPYFDKTKKFVPFAQWRHLSGDRRFTMLKDARPIVYGLWNLDNPKIFVVEGTSDCAVLDYCAVPYVGMPSAASKTLMQGMAEYCKKNGIQVVYAGDNDEAGDRLREALGEVMSYRVKQPPRKYKDWGDYFEAEGLEVVRNYCQRELFPERFLAVDSKPELIDSEEWEAMTEDERIDHTFPNNKQLKLINTGS